MAGFTISGLSSGIDTTSVISQLMTVAANPQTLIKQKLTALQGTDAAYQALNGYMASIKTAADTVAGSTAYLATTATASDSSITATSDTTAIPGTSTTFSITQLAKSQVSTATIADSTNAASSTAGLDITIGATGSQTTTHITPASNSAADVVSAINAANIGVKASLISTDNGTVMQFAAANTGSAGAFTISGLTGGTTLQNISTAQDAKLSVGTVGSGGYTVTSSSNTFSNAIPGVTFTASALVSNATISVASDSSAASTAMNNLVKSITSALLNASASTAQGNTLAGDSLATGINDALSSIVSAGTATGTSWSDIGVDVSKDGSVLTFDASAFQAAYQKDPAKLQSLATALGTAFSKVADSYSNSSTGSLSQAITADATQETAYTKQISDWDDKLANMKTSLQAKYAAMEAALSKMKSTSSYLTSMFNSINGTTSSTSSSSTSSG